MGKIRSISFHTLVTILMLQIHVSDSFLTARLEFQKRTFYNVFMSSEEELPIDTAELSTFEKDILEAFSTSENRDDALTNAAYTAFARDLRNVGDWEDESNDDDFLVNEVEAFEIYTETYNDMGEEVDLESFRADVSEEERQLIDEIVASTKNATFSAHDEQENDMNSEDNDETNL